MPNKKKIKTDPGYLIRKRYIWVLSLYIFENLDHVLLNIKSFCTFRGLFELELGPYTFICVKFGKCLAALACTKFYFNTNKSINTQFSQIKI